MMIISRTTPMMPMMIIIFMLAHHCFRLSLPACCSNWDAPCCSASARWSSSESFWSRSRTFSTLTRMMPTTSSTWAWVCLSRLAVAPLALLAAGWVLPVGGGGNLGKLYILEMYINERAVGCGRGAWVMIEKNVLKLLNFILNLTLNINV